MANAKPALIKAHKYAFGWGWYMTGLLAYRILDDQLNIYVLAIVIMLAAFVIQKVTRGHGSYKLDLAGWLIAITLIPIAIQPFVIVRIVDYIALTILLDAVMDFLGKKVPVGSDLVKDDQSTDEGE